jgi:hypothetical protein
MGETMTEKKTHRENKSPTMSARYLADYMAATEPVRRTIVRRCKYPAIARIIQHDLAKTAISAFLIGKGGSLDALAARAQALRDRFADDDFDRHLLDANADYVARFAALYPAIEMPAAELLPAGQATALPIGGVKVNFEMAFRLRRVTKTNKVRVGGGMLRYAKGKALKKPVALWQSALLFGYMGLTANDGETPERKLCLTLDAQGGHSYEAPTDAARRFTHMQAACESITDQWPNVKPPKDAVL